ncbi:hypothetical protein E4U35_002894 [Claviceps purpurea]|nr:hypothetical protein E4U35_002894 [Claviceps purpurea]
MTLDLLGPRSPEDQRGRHNMVFHFVLIQVISRESSAWCGWAVVTPDFHHKNRTILILGLPWLHDVGAKFDIRNSELTLDIEERGDEVSTIRGPKATSSDRQKTWKDNAPVLFVTTLYFGLEHQEVVRRRPSSTQPRAKQILAFYGDETHKAINQPSIAVDYNNHMRSIHCAEVRPPTEKAKQAGDGFCMNMY